MGAGRGVRSGAAVLAVLLVGACSETHKETAAAPEPPVALEHTWVEALGEVSPLTMPKTLPQRPARINLPTSVPGSRDELPSLLDDPPGRALMIWYPAPASGCSVQGWVRETIDFYGVDGRWRRLNLTDLSLPRSSWPGCSSNGPGSLSPDGRWWAIGAKGLFVLVNLKTGSILTKASRSGWPGLWAQDSQQLVTLGSRAGSLWQVPGIHLTDTPGMKESGTVWPLPDGGYVTDDDMTSDDPEGGSMTLRYYTSAGDPSKTRRVPTPPASHCSVDGGFLGDRVGMVCVTRRSEPQIFYVLDESSWTVEAALQIPPGADAYPQQLLNPRLWALSTGDSVAMWWIDQGDIGTVLSLPDEAKSAKWDAFNQFGLAGGLVTDGTSRQGPAPDETATTNQTRARFDPPGIKDEVDPPAPSISFGTINAWTGWFGGDYLAVYAGDAGYEHPNTGKVMVFTYDNDRTTRLIYSRTVPGSGALKVVAVHKPTVQLRGAHGRRYLLDLNTKVLAPG